MVELNYAKLRKHLYDLIEVKGEKPAHITAKTNVWNIKKMMDGDNEPTIKSWAQLHAEYPNDIPAPEYIDGATVYKNTTTGDNSHAVGHNMTVTNNAHTSPISPGIQYLFSLLEQKDPRGKMLQKFIAEMIALPDHE